MSGTGAIGRAVGITGLDLGNASSETLFKNILGETARLRLPTDGQLTNKRFAVKMAGRVATTTNLTFTVNVYLGTNTTAFASDTLIFSSGPQTVNAKKTNWHFDVDLMWDGDSQNINGLGEGQLDNGPIGQISLANVFNLDPNLHNTTNSFQGVIHHFVVTGQFSGSSAGNHAFIDVMEMDLR